MNYHLKSKRRTSSEKRFFVLALITALIVLVVLPGVFFTIGAVTLKSVHSVRGAIVTGYTVTSSYFISHADLALKNKDLTRIANEIQAYKSQNDVLRSENSELLGLSIDSDERVARVIAVPPQSPYGIVVLEVPEEVSEGDLMFSESGVLLGYVKNVSGSYAKADLYSRGGNSIDVQNSRTGERYTIYGRGSGNFSLEFPQDSDVLVGDILISRIDGVHVVGEIKEFETRENRSIVTGYVNVPLPIYDLSYVVLKHVQANEEPEE